MEQNEQPAGGNSPFLSLSSGSSSDDDLADLKAEDLPSKSKCCGHSLNRLFLGRVARAKRSRRRSGSQNDRQMRLSSQGSPERKSMID